MNASVLSIAALLIAAAPTLILAWFIVEVAAGLRPCSQPDAAPIPPTATGVILVPAHDEMGGIAQTVAALRSICPVNCRVVVIADNCSDLTASVARDDGALVIERHDPDRRGKGFALAFGRDHIAPDPPDVVIVVDADCRLAPGTVEALIAAVIVNGRPAQARDVILPDLALPPLAQISSFAMLVKNVIRQRGLMRIADCSLLCGTGMAFAWRDFAAAPLATGNAVEDLGLAVEMIGAGLRPQLIEGGLVTSRAASIADSVAQRSRWEHGFMRTALRHALPELGAGVATASRARIALGLHLLVPPLALLFAASVAILALVTVIGWYADAWLPAIALGSAIALAGALVFIAWAREGRDTLSSKALLSAPLYVLWKLPIYLRFVRQPATAWTRTRREAE